MEHGISKLDLKRQNRMQVLKILKQQGPTSRIDIAYMLELTRAAVTIITNEMIEQGIIHEIGEYKHTSEKAPRGRKKILIDINYNFKFVVGVTVEEKVLSVGLSTLTGGVLDKRNMEINEKTTFDEIFKFSKESALQILSDNCLDKSNILGIGVGIFPTMLKRMNVKIYGGEPDYKALVKKISEATSLPVVIDNSVKGSAMANIDFEKGRDANRINTAFLQYGNSLHFAVTNLNDPIKSYDNRTNFVDKIIVNPTAEAVNCDCGRRGCAKSEITPDAIVRKVKEIFSAEKTPILFNICQQNPENVNMENIVDAFKEGDDGIAEIRDNILTYFSVLLNNLYFSTNPQKIVLHDFSFSEEEYAELIDRVKSVGGDVVADSIDLSIIEDKHKFLSGSALAIRTLFYTRGGYEVKN